MDRTTGTGLVTFGIVLGVVGAIMRYAVHVSTQGFNVHMAGVILLIVGIVALLVGTLLVLLANRSRSYSSTEEHLQQTPSGQIRTEDRVDHLS